MNNLIDFAIDSLKNNYVDKESGGVFDLPQGIDNVPIERKKKLLYNSVCAIGLSYYAREKSLFEELIAYLQMLSARHSGLVPTWEGEYEQTLGEHGLLLWALSRGYQILQKEGLLVQCRKVFSTIEKYVNEEGVPHFPQTRYFDPMSTAFCLDGLLEYQIVESTSQGRMIINHLVDCLTRECHPPVFLRKENGNFLPKLTFNHIVYPIHALSRYSIMFNDNNCKSLIEKVVKSLLILQGEMGQWWWWYSQSGEVIGKYPVFSVHQHGMAIMTLLVAKPLVSKDVAISIDSAIRLSFEWIWGKNELSKSMVDEENLLIFRSIQYPIAREKFFRPLQILGIDRYFLRINPLCRSYEFGWLLYAAHLQKER
jgi:hypothetical protein